MGYLKNQNKIEIKCHNISRQFKIPEELDAGRGGPTEIQAPPCNDEGVRINA